MAALFQDWETGRGRDTPREDTGEHTRGLGEGRTGEGASWKAISSFFIHLTKVIRKMFHVGCFFGKPSKASVTHTEQAVWG